MAYFEQLAVEAGAGYTDYTRRLHVSNVVV